MSGNRTDNGVLEVGTDEVRVSYSEDTPGQTVEQYIKEREKSFHESKKRTEKQFSQVFQNPLDGYPYNEAIKVTPIKEDFGIFEAKDLNDVEFDVKKYSKMYKSAKFKETKKGIEVKVKGKTHTITKHPMYNGWVIDGRQHHMIPSINTAIGIIMSRHEQISEINTKMPEKVRIQILDLYNKAMDLPYGSPAFKKVKAEIDKINKKYSVKEESFDEAIAFGFDTMKGANTFKRKFPDSNPVQIVKLTDNHPSGATKKHIVSLRNTEQASKDYVEKAAKFAAQVSLSEESLNEEGMELKFANSGAAEKAYKIINNKIYAGGNNPFEIEPPDGSYIYFSDVENAKEVIKQLKKGGLKFTVEMLKEESLNEETVIDVARRVVDKKGAEKIKGVMLDMFTASAIIQVYDKVNDKNKEKMEKMDLPKLAAAVWKILGK